MATALRSPATWSAKGTTPSAIEAALLELMHRHHNERMLQAPARVLNFVVVVDRAMRDEVFERLEGIGRDNPARTLLIVVEDDKEDLDATATLVHGTPGELGGETVFRERLELVCGRRHIERLATIVAPLLASEVATVVWSPWDDDTAIDALRGLATSVLVDSLEHEDWREAINRMQELSAVLEVSDLAWLRSTPWRERLAATFDPPLWRRELIAIDRVEVRMHPGSTMAALLFVGWLASRLDWQLHVLSLDDAEHRFGEASGPAGPIEISFENDPTMPVPGLAGLTIGTANGLSLELNRAAGGLRAKRTLGDGTVHGWTMIGASRGEHGILSNGVTHAISPDELFRPALEAACTFCGRASVARAREQRG